MAKKRRTQASRIRIKTNEPEKHVPGGSKRRSTIVGREALGGIARREELDELLLAHDPEIAEAAMIQISRSDTEILRQIAREGAITGVEPVVRKRAIEHLGRFPDGENLDLLIDLATRGEDIYVRGSALRALAKTGLGLAVDIAKNALLARDPLEAQQARLAMADLYETVGAAVLKRRLSEEPNRKTRQAFAEALDAIEKPAPAKRRRRLTPATDEPSDRGA